MGLFGKKKERRKRRPRDPEREARLIELKEKKAASDLFVKQMAEADPETQRAYAASILNRKLDLPVPRSLEDRILDDALESDPKYKEEIKQAKIDAVRGGKSASSQLEREADRLALERFKTDTDLQEKVADRRLRRLQGMGGGPFGEMIEYEEQMAELRARLGSGEDGNDSLWGKILDPDVIQGIGAILSVILGGKMAAKTYVIETGDGLVEMGAAEYKKFLEQKGRIALPERTEETEPRPFTAEPAPQQPPPPDIPSAPPQTLNISSWAGYLDEPAADFINSMQELAGYGDEDAKNTLAVLASVDAATLLASLAKVREEAPEDARHVIDHLTENPSWLEEAIKLAKEHNVEQNESSE